MIKFLHYTESNFTLIGYTDLLIAQSLEAVSLSVDWINLKGDQFQEAHESLIDYVNGYEATDSPYLIFDSCGKSTLPIETEKKIPYYFSYFSDTPYAAFFEHIVLQPANGCLSYSDQNFKLFFDDIGISEDQEYIFLPHGGPNNIMGTQDIPDRKIDFLFCGSIRDMTDINDLIRSYSKGDPFISRIIKMSLDYSIECNLDLYHTFKSVSANFGYSPFEVIPLTEFAPFMQDLLHWKENYLRLKVIKSFAGTGMWFAGRIDNTVTGIHSDDFHYLGPKLGRDILGLMQNSKMVLNPVSVFPGGSHERIWFSMAAGATVLSDRSTFLEETLTDKENIFYIDYDNLTHQVKGLVDICQSEPNRLQQMVHNTQEIYLQSHTWYQRIKEYVLPSNTFQQYLTNLQR